MKYYHCVLLLFFLSNLQFISAQSHETIHELSSRFSYQIIQYKLAVENQQLNSAVSLLDKNAHITKGDSVLIEIQAEQNQVPHYQKINIHGGNIKHTYKNWASGYIHIDDLIALDEKIATSDYISIVPNVHSADNEGPGVMNSDTYNTNGLGGNGLKIAVIDGGFSEWDLALQNTPGCLPASYTYVDCSSGTCFVMSEDTGSQTHGRACAQVVFDHAPSATYYMIKASANSQKAAAIAWADLFGIDIISMSLSSYNAGWADNSGVVCDATNDALANDDMLIFVSAGNRNGTHYQSVFSDPNGNDAHNYSGGDESNNITINNGQAFNVSLQWSGSLSLSNNLSLIVIDVSSGSVVASSLNTTSFESVSVTNNTGAPNTYGVRILNSGTTTPTFEYWNSGVMSNFEYASSGNSTTSPANSTEPNVIGVSAVRWEDFGTDSSVIISRASIGPTNGGGAAVDLTGPTGCTTARSDGTPNRFGFTSGATPNVAGAAAAFWSRHPSLSANDVRSILFLKASLYEDLLAPGFDHGSGHGGLHLFEYDIDNIYIDQNAGQNGTPPSSGVYPWDNVGDVDTFAPAGKKVIFLTDDDNATPTLLNKAMLLTTPRIEGVIID